MKLSIAKQLWIMCAAFVFILCGTGFGSFLTSRLISGQLDNTVNVQMKALRNMTLADMMHDGIRGVVNEVLVVANEKKTDELKDLQKEMDEKCDQFLSYIKVLEDLPMREDTKKAISETKPAIEKYVASGKEVVSTAASKGYAEALTHLPGFNESFKFLEKKMESLGELIERDSEGDLSSGRVYTQINLLISGFFLLVTSLGSFFTMRKLIRELNDFISQIRTAGVLVFKASQEMTETSKSASRNSTESAASLEETVASLEELNSMVKVNTENAQHASDLSTSSLSTAKSGKEEIVALISTMSDLADSSQKMEEIINVIDDIAFQTNLLALNAAVEAARAGEQGKGFAVVAEAVRSLAQRSALAAKDISQMIKESVQKISYGNGVASRSGESLENIVTSVNKVSELNSLIAVASKDQANGLLQISSAMNNLDKSTQDNAQASAVIMNASGDMLSQSQNLETMVKEFEELALGKKAA